jgi:predicted transposase YdaD
MTILRESPWYQTILQEGLAKGEQQGIQQGEFELVNRLIKKRFGEVSENTKFKIKNLSIEQLELLGESLFDFNSLDDVNNWLDNL